MWKLEGLDEKIARILTQEHGLKIRETLFDLPFDILLSAFILLSATAGFILGYNWYRIFKAKN